MIMVGALGKSLTGLVTTKDFATGMDFPFSCVICSQHHKSHFPYQWDTYVHASGRCGRQPGQLGLAVIFISSPVRCLILWCQTVRRGLTLHSVQDDAQKWESTFQELVKKQPDLCDRIGALLWLLTYIHTYTSPAASCVNVCVGFECIAVCVFALPLQRLS